MNPQTVREGALDGTLFTDASVTVYGAMSEHEPQTSVMIRVSPLGAGACIVPGLFALLAWLRYFVAGLAGVTAHSLTSITTSPAPTVSRGDTWTTHGRERSPSTRELIPQRVDRQDELAPVDSVPASAVLRPKDSRIVTGNVACP